MYLIILKFRFKIEFLLFYFQRLLHIIFSDMENIAKLHGQSWKSSSAWCIIPSCATAFYNRCNYSVQQHQALPTFSLYSCRGTVFPHLQERESSIDFPPTHIDFRKLSLVIEGLAFISWKKVDTVRWVENKSNKDHHRCMTSWPAKQ